MIKNRKGIAFVVALVLMFILLGLGAAYLMITRSEIQITTNQMNALRAFYLAEAAAEDVMAELEIEGGDGIVAVDGGFDEDQTYSATATVIEDGYFIVATGDAYGAAGKVEITVVWDPFVYAVESGGEIKFDNASGTLNGDLYYEESFVQDGMVVTGATEAGYDKRTPTANIDISSFLLQNPTVIDGDKTFDAAGSPYTGVWYIVGDAIIKDGAVINGTIVAENDIKSKAQIKSLSINPSEDYALVAGNDIDLNNVSNAEISGFMYAGDDLSISNTENSIINSTLVAKNDMHLSMFGNVTIVGGLVADNEMHVNNLNNVNITGGLIVGDDLHGNNISDFNITFDPALAPPDFTGGLLNIVSWRGRSS